MRFTYTYRSSDGQRHSGEIEAASRDAAFVAGTRVDGLAVATTNVAFSGDVANVMWPIPDLEEVTVRTKQPKYVVEASVAGVEDGNASGTFYRDDLREWEGNKIGLSGTVVPPFTPLERTGE